MFSLIPLSILAMASGIHGQYSVYQVIGYGVVEQCDDAVYISRYLMYEDECRQKIIQSSGLSSEPKCQFGCVNSLLNQPQNTQGNAYWVKEHYSGPDCQGEILHVHFTQTNIGTAGSDGVAFTTCTPGGSSQFMHCTSEDRKDCSVVSTSPFKDGQCSFEFGFNSWLDKRETRSVKYRCVPSALNYKTPIGGPVVTSGNITSNSLPKDMSNNSTANAKKDEGSSFPSDSNGAVSLIAVSTVLYFVGSLISMMLL